MIYFLDNDLELQKIVTSENINRAQHEDEMNNLKMMTLEMDLAYAKSFLNDDIDHFGYYVKDAFHVAKIRRVEESHDGETLTVIGHHIFFSDMIYGRLVEDVRPENRDAAFILNNTIGANTRWHPVITDTTGVLSTNFYWTTPMEVVEFVVENFRLEFEPEILFDGQKVNGLNVHFKKRLGEDKPKRVVFGPNTPSLQYDVDYSEIVTKLAVHGKGEEVGDGYGRRINFSDRNINRDGIVSPLGSRYLEDPNVTANYGNFNNEPKHANVIFEDIEDVNELIEAGIQEYERLSRPQYIFEASVTDIGDVNIGDSVLIVRREHGIYFRARVHKISVDLLNPDDAEVVLGDYEHFKETKAERSARRQRESNERAVNSRITELKNAFDARFDGEVAQMWEDYEQALIDAHAEIEAAEQRMETLITTTRNDWTDTFDAEVAEIYRKADEDYNRIETEINGVIDSTREEMRGEFNEKVTLSEQRAAEERARIESEVSGVIDSTREEMEMNFSDAVQGAREYAELQAQAKADAVRTDLETVTSGHQGMIDDLQSSVLDIDDFLGSDRNVGLNEMLYNERIHMEERINSINTWHYNLLRETQSLDDEHWQALGGTLEIGDSGERYFKSSSSALVSRALESKESMLFEAGETYTLTFQVQTYGHRRMDNVFIISTDSEIFPSNFDLDSNADVQTANVIHFGGEYRTYFITFTMPFDVYGKIRIGGDYRNNDLGVREYRIKKPYLTQSDNKQWLHNPEDSLQNLEEVTRRVTLLEDGREEFITRTQYDFETGEIEGTIRNILETVDGRESTIQNHEDWINTNGASVIESAVGFQSKAWLSDIHNPNMLNFTNVTDSSHFNNWRLVVANLWGVSYAEWLMVRQSNSTNSYLGVYTPEFNVQAGQTVTYSFEAWENGNDTVDSTSGNMDYTFFAPVDGANQSIWITQKRTRLGSINGTDYYQYYGTFTPEVTTSRGRLLIGTRRRSGTGQQDLRFRFRHPKLEIGDRVTPYHNAYSMLNQRSDSIALQVDDQESRISNFTVDLDGILGRVSDIEGDYITQSSLEITPEYAQIGSMRIDGDTVGSLLRVSPSGIDAVAEAMRLSGDLYIDGDIKTLAISAIEAEFASLWADEFSAITIDVEDINGITAYFEDLMVDDAIVERLLATSVFADGVTARIGDFIEGNFGSLWAAELESNLITADHIDTSTLNFSMISGIDAFIDRLVARSAFVDAIAGRELYFTDGTIGRLESAIIRANVIEAEHIAVGTALIDKLFATSARIDRLITKTHFVNEIKATSIDAVHADLRSVNSEIMDTNILKADWIQGGNALLDKVFANTAMFERMMAKSGFISTMSAITLDLYELTIWRPDGVALINDGMARFGHPVPLTPYMDSTVEWTGQRYETFSRGASTFSIAPGEHAGQYYNIVVGMGLKYNSQSASSLMDVVIRVQNSPSGTNWPTHWRRQYTVTKSSTNWQTISIPLGRPTFGAFLFTLEFNRVGESYQENTVEIRTGRSWVSS